MNILKKCKICGGKNFKFLFKQRDKNLNFPDKFSLYKCYNCGILFLNPQPTNKELEKHYPKKKYYSLRSVKTEKESKKTKLRIFLYDLYFGSKKNIFLKTLFFPIKFSVRGTKIAPNRKLLDIGSGSGQFLYEMKQLGMVVYGVEPGNFNIKGAKNEGLNILKTDLINAKYSSNFFYIVTLNHVLEHVENPRAIIKEIHRILKKKGSLIISVPNFRSLAYKIFEKNWYQLDVPRHLFNFSDKNLKELLQKEGFKINKIRYNSRPSQFVISLLFALNIKHRNKIIISFLDMLFLPLTWLVNLLKTGDQIEIWCVKR